MTPTISHNPIIEADRIRELTAFLKQKEDEIQSLQNQIKQLESSHFTLQGEIEACTNKLLQENRVLKDSIEKKFDDLVRIIKYSGITGKFKHLLKPRIGILHQYDTFCPPRLPKHYNNDLIPLKNPPSLSIVTPSYNQGAFIERTILSIIEQNYPALEYIIQDGGSTDETLQVIEKYKPYLKHSESKKDSGQSNAINLGFRHATGEIMAYLNSDDILLPGSLHYIAQYFSKHPEIDVVYGHRILINQHDHEIGKWVLPKHDGKALTWADYIPQETLFWRRSLWDKVGATIDESFKFAMDWDLLMRFQAVGARFVRLPRFLGAFRVHSSQKTSSTINDTGMREMEKIRTRLHGRQISNKEINKKLKWYLIQHVIYQKLYATGLFRY